MVPVLLLLVLAQASPIDPPEGQKLVLTAFGKGVQIYECDQGADGTYLWRLDHPEAELMNEKHEHIGTHKAGPTWESYDGSLVTGKRLKQQPSPNPDAIPWMLLTGESHSGLSYGELSRVEYIQRVDTSGGISPTTGCDAAHLNAKVRVPYSATYKFYRGDIH
jgi:hypothetical protein